MRTLLPAPRQPYRVYSEEEFLAAEDWPEPVDAEPACASIAARGMRPWGRAVALAAFCVVAVAVTGAVAMNEVRSRAGSGRRLASRRIVSRLPREGHALSSPPTAGRGASGGVAGRRLSAGWASAAARSVAEHDTHVVPRLAAHTSVRSQPGSAGRAAISAPAATSTATDTPATVPAAIAIPAAPPVETASAETATAATGAADTASVRGAGSEFGFER